MTEIVSFPKERALKEQDNRLWTPKDALEALLKEIEAGRVKADSCVLIVAERCEHGTVGRHEFIVSNLSSVEAVGLLDLSKLNYILAGPQ